MVGGSALSAAHDFLLPPRGLVVSCRAFQLIQSQGRELKKRGKDWVVHCVFHDESTPSLSVSEVKKSLSLFRLRGGRFGDRLGDENPRRVVAARGSTVA
jgi:hypothetical protein